MYCGERDRARGRFLADLVVDELERAEAEAAIVIRGVEGFGAKHRLRTDRLLTLSEDLPVVAIGVGHPDRIAAAADRIRGLPVGGLVCVEALTFAGVADADPPPGGPAKLSVLLGRGRRVAGRPAYEWLVGRLREAGVAGATVLLGVDGIVAGTRRRAGFFAANADVPAMVVAIGDGERIASALGDGSAMPPGAIVTIGPAVISKRDGGPLQVRATAGGNSAASAAMRRLTLYSSEQAQAAGRPVHVEAVRRLREAGAAGATALRGVWGFDGRHPPHGDRLLALRRSVPTITVVVDEPERADEWLRILDELTPERGLITTEDFADAQSRPSGTS